MDVAARPVEVLLEPRQARRVRWCSVLAAAICASHFMSAIILFGWYYYIVPRWKYELTGFGYEMTPQSYFVFGTSDAIFVGLYLLFVIAPVTLLIDFVATRWIARQVGLRSASLVGLFIVLLMFVNIAIGQAILHDAKAKLVEHVSIHGPSPTARPSEE